MGRSAAILAFTAALAAGCGGDPAATTMHGDDGSLVAYSRSGGFASYPVRLEVQADGAATVEVQVEGAGSSSFELGEQDLAGLRETLEAAEFDQLDGPLSTTCGDCFSYEVVYGGATYAYDDATDVVPESVRAAVAELDRIANQHAPVDTLTG